MKEELIVGSVGTTLGIIGTSTQVNDVLKTISLVVTIIGALITYIVVPLLVWYKKAKEDGKITSDEVKDAIDIVEDGAKKTQDEIDKNKDK